MHGMRPFGALISHEEALARLLAAAIPSERAEALPLAQARGRVAAADVRAPFDVPPFDRAMMDGYALRAADARDPGARLRCIGEAHAGRPFEGAVNAGECVRIATGAAVPQGANAVLRVEDTREDGDSVDLTRAVPIGLSIDPQGNDMKKGATVVRSGNVLTPARLGLLASLGFPDVRVRALPRVALHVTGDELLRPGDALRPGAIYDSNSTSLRTFLESAGALVHVAAPLPDNLAQVCAALRDSAATADMVVFTGGASVGERDLTVDALRSEGDVLFHGVRLKPGKPLLGGRVGRAVVVGLPGNPTSALSNAALFLAPVIAQLTGAPPPADRVIVAHLANEVVGDAERYTFLPVRLVEGRAVPTFKGSGALTSLAESEGWMGVPEGVHWREGTRVDVHLW